MMVRGMKILCDLNAACRSRGLSYVLVGGHAIIARGYARTTRDVDLAISENEREAWREVFHLLGYTLFHEQPGFLQLTAPDLGQWPVDLMVVDGSTYSRLQAEAESLRLGGESAPVASVTHLILMKLHAMKTGPVERRAKDLADLIELLRLRKLDPRSAEFRAMCEKYADREIHERTIDFWG
jgi:hypothetical protein